MKHSSALAVAALLETAGFGSVHLVQIGGDLCGVLAHREGNTYEFCSIEQFERFRTAFNAKGV
jgi:hypothetical protein